jgi:hypothetical protein
MATKTPNLEGPSLTAVNAGAGPHFDVLEVGHPDYVALINADTAFWVLADLHRRISACIGVYRRLRFNRRLTPITQIPKTEMASQVHLGMRTSIKFKADRRQLLLSVRLPTTAFFLPCGWPGGGESPP